MRNSDRTFRVAAGLWTAMGLIAASAYTRLAVLGGRQAQGTLLASTLLIQPIGISLWVARQRFMSRAEAAIRSVATAVAIGWLPFFALIPALFGRFQSSWNADRLQLGFVSTFLVLGGLAGGTTFGILRWRQQAGQTTDVSQRGLVKNLLQGELRASVAYWQMDDGEGAFKVKLG